MPNARIKELCGVTKGVGERIEDGSAKLEEWGIPYTIAKRVLGESVGILLVGLPQNRWIDCVTGSLNVRQAKKMAYDGNEWWGFVRNGWGYARRMNP